MTEESLIDLRIRELRARDAEIPLAPDALREAALERLPGDVYDYVAGGAGDEDTMRADRRAFDRYRIVPRVLRDVGERDLSTTLLGREVAAPVFLAPVGGQGLYHDEGERASARAAAAQDLAYTMSTVSSTPIEAVAEAADGAARNADGVNGDAGDAPRLFQLYWSPDWDLARRLVERAEAAGFDAIVVTLDTQVERWHRRSLENAFSIWHEVVANLTSDPVFQARAREEGVPIEEVLGDDPLTRDASLTWDDLATLRDWTDLPIVLKGILHPADARLALEHGVDAVQVSTHGGRNVDGAIGSLAALPGVVDAVDGEVPVLFDGGVRGGADAFTALALGADAVGLGRPFVYGLALAGERGVREVLANVLAELDSVVGLTGHVDVADVGRDAVVDSYRES